MKKIVSVIKPFVIDQNIFVYEDGNKIDAVTSSVDNLPETILQLTKQYELNNVELAGPVSYLKGLQKQIQELEMDTYATNNIEIKIITN